MTHFNHGSTWPTNQACVEPMEADGLLVEALALGIDILVAAAPRPDIKLDFRKLR